MNAPLTRAELGMPDETMPQAPANSFADSAAAQMERLLADFGRMYRERNQALLEVAQAHHEALLRLSRAAEYRDDDTGVHIVRIGYLAWAMALKLGESRSFATLLRQAAPMHDVGKIGIADSVLKKPGRLTDDERKAMNRHPEIGAEILGRSRIPLFQLAAEVALTHHERWDGTGYPRKLAGDAIPISGRITAVVDFFDAVSMDRCYRPAFSAEMVRSMLIEQRGGAFDPRVLDCFIDNYDEMVALRDRVNGDGMDLSDLALQAPDAAFMPAALS